MVGGGDFIVGGHIIGSCTGGDGICGVKSTELMEFTESVSDRFSSSILSGVVSIGSFV